MFTQEENEVRQAFKELRKSVEKEQTEIFKKQREFEQNSIQYIMLEDKYKELCGKIAGIYACEEAYMNTISKYVIARGERR